MSLQSPLLMLPTASTAHFALSVNSGSSLTCYGNKPTKNTRCDVHVKKQNPTRVPELVALEAQLALLEKQVVTMAKAMTKVKQEEGVLKMDVKKIEAKTPSVKVEPRARPRFADDSETESSPTPSPSSSKSLKTTSPKHIFEPFSKAPGSAIANNQAIKELLLRPLLKTEFPSNGSIYAFTFPDNYRDTQPFLKIGYTNNVDRRLSEWRTQCKYTPKKVFSFDTELYVKVEKLVHKELHGVRKREVKCPGCGTTHREWFDVSIPRATSSVALWMDFMRQEPYDELGKLKEEWRVRVEKVDLQDPHCWTALVTGGRS